MNDDIVKDFLVESQENLDRLDRDLVGLEKNPKDKDALAGVFRTIHTIKGTCGFLGFNKLEKVAHVGENLLSRLRDGQMTLNPEITTALLGMVDAIRQMLKDIESTGSDGTIDYPELRETLTQLQSGASAASQESVPAVVPAQVSVERTLVSKPAKPPKKSKRAATAEAAATLAAVEFGQGTAASRAEISVEQDDGTTVSRALPVRSRHDDDTAVTRALPLNSQQDDYRTVGPAVPVHSQAKVVTKTEDQPSAQVAEAKPREAAAETIRVGVNLLDKLMTQVGELVLARNQLLQIANTVGDAGLHAVSQRMNLIATELQEEVMKTRMQPIGNIWSQFPRTVRDVALGCNKEVGIEMEGEKTELDKTIIEAIKDPLTHLVRNSVDHGIELPAERIKAGKARAGRLILRAFHESGQVNIEISDDGAGLNAERIRQKAIERGVIGAEQAARMTEREIYNLIFLPGFSTAEKVTNVSGRGVGMDVVKTNVERIGGNVDVQSTRGQGTTVRVKIPLTLAIIPALVVTCCGERYAIPQISLLELVRLEADEISTGIELVHGAPVHRLRGQLLPLVYLSRELKLEVNAKRAVQGDSAVNIVVLQADARQFGLIVDQINDTEEIVVKPLRKQLKMVKTFAGSSIMGDGKVALILDVLGLAQRAGVVTEARERAMTQKAAESINQEEKQTFLLFAGPGDSRMAIPLSTLARLEEFPVAQVEISGSQWVTQYRGQILPLIRLNVVLEERRNKLRALQAPPAVDAGPIQVLVLNHEGRAFGLVVEKILDIIEDPADVRSPATRTSVLYSVVIGSRVTELLDVPAILRGASLNPARSSQGRTAAEVAN
jgi:two-component system, chemotaxis family, sensor kinase CheA